MENSSTELDKRLDEHMYTGLMSSLILGKILPIPGMQFPRFSRTKGLN